MRKDDLNLSPVTDGCFVREITRKAERSFKDFSALTLSSPFFTPLSYFAFRYPFSSLLLLTDEEFIGWLSPSYFLFNAILILILLKSCVSTTSLGTTVLCLLLLLCFVFLLVLSPGKGITV